MRHCGRLFRWTALFGFLGAVGTAVFIYVRYQPRCQIDGSLEVKRLTPDGSRLITLDNKADRSSLQVWDTATGRVLHEFNADSSTTIYYDSPNGQHAVLVLADGSFRLVDLLTGAVCVDEEFQRVSTPQLSPKGRWLEFYRPGADAPWCIYDIARARVALNLNGGGVYSADERLLFGLDADQGGGIWEVETGTKIASLDLDVVPTDTCPQNRFLLTRRRHGNLEVAEIWDMNTRQRTMRRGFPSPEAGSATFFSPDSRHLVRLAYSVPGDRVHLTMIETATGSQCWEYTTTKPINDWIFAPDGALAYMQQHINFGKPVLSVVDVVSGRVLWEANGSAIHFAIDNAAIIVGDSGLEIVDARTGVPRAKSPVHVHVNLLESVPLTSDGRRLAFLGTQRHDRDPNFFEKRWPELFGIDVRYGYVIEAATGRILFRVPTSGWHCLLSQDGSTLVTADADATGRRTTRIFDVGPRRAWTWAAAAVTASWLALWGLGRLLARRRKA